MLRCRSVRQFSDRPVPDEAIENCVRVAASAPNAANQQPWHFVVVRDAAMKRRIREAAEREEFAFYHDYLNESVGIATRMPITALHHAGLAALPHVVSPMGSSTRC